MTEMTFRMISFDFQIKIGTSRLYYVDALLACTSSPSSPYRTRLVWGDEDGGALYRHIVDSVNETFGEQRFWIGLDDATGEWKSRYCDS